MAGNNFNDFQILPKMEVVVDVTFITRMYMYQGINEGDFWLEVGAKTHNTNVRTCTL